MVSSSWSGPEPLVSDKVIADALAALGWVQPASTLKVIGNVQPIMAVPGTPAYTPINSGVAATVSRLGVFASGPTIGKAWRLYFMGMRTAVAATASLGAFQPYMVYPSTGTLAVWVPLGPQLNTPPGPPSTNESLCGFIPPSPIYLPYPCTIGFQYTGLTDATATAAMTGFVVETSLS